MYKLPDLPAPKTLLVFSERAKEQWLKALNRPEADMRYQAAQTISLAHRRGMKGLETTVPTLLARSADNKEHAAVRLESVKALIEVDARQTAASLMSIAQSGSNDLRELIEPALARWDHKPAREVWLERVRNPESSGRSLALAISALAKVREQRAAEELRQLAVSDRSTPAIRVESARALGLLRSDGLEEDAKRLAGNNSVRGLSDRLAAALLLQQHKNEEAVRLLQRLTLDREPAVAAVAVAGLLDLDPKYALAHLDHLLKSTDAKLRGLGVDVLRRVHDEKHVALLGARLGDVHPEVRTAARRAMQELAVKHSLRSQVLAEGMRVLAATEWKGQEQAAILLSDLGYKPAGHRLVDLLKAPRSEVFVTAAWALRRLAVHETMPGVVEYMQSQLPLFRGGGRRGNRPEASLYLIDHQLSQLNQLLGQQKFHGADAILPGFVPRMSNVISFESRAAAIWALGVLFEGKRDAELEKLAVERLTDTNSMPPEDVRVRRMSAILLGRLGAKDTLKALRRFTANFEFTGEPVNDACNWSIARLTGAKLPAPKTIERTQIDWFLRPR
jgi:HEAT repeat protein